MMKKIGYLCVLVAFMSLIQGCETMGYKDKAEPAHVKQGTSVAEMLEQANQLILAKRMDSAEGLLERVVSIEPNNAKAWYMLSKVRLEDGYKEDALSFAQKALLLSGKDEKLKWQIISLMKQIN